MPMFNTKYPIVAVGMNQVSTIKLAIAVSNAGAVATVSGFNYIDIDKTFNFSRLITDLELYQSSLNNCNFILSISDRLLLKYSELLTIIKAYKVMFLELIVNCEFLENQFLLNGILSDLKSENIKVLIKIISISPEISKPFIEYVNSSFDGIIIKGPLGAGRVRSLVNSSNSLSDLTQHCFDLFPGKSIVPCGGVGTPEEVKELIDLGAAAVGIGTLFAASAESPLSLEAKRKLISSNFEEVEKLNTTDLKQNALVFTRTEQDGDNNTAGLIKGIRSGIEGHLFAGKGINQINEIRSVKNIVEDLCSLL